MCLPKAPKVQPTPPTPAPPEPGPSLSINDGSGAGSTKSTKNKRYGTALLRNDLSIPASSSGSGLNIP